MALPPLVLLVDDFADNRMMYAEILSFAGLRVAEATSGEEGLAGARELLPAAIVMDLSLPRMDGWETTRRLRADPRTRHIPVIALSGLDGGDDLRRAREAGCSAHLVKPCLPDDLVRKVLSVIDRPR